jgi:hypothetical protein
MGTAALGLILPISRVEFYSTILSEPISVNALPIRTNMSNTATGSRGRNSCAARLSSAATNAPSGNHLVGAAIFRARYGDECWKKRVERTRKHGVGAPGCAGSVAAAMGRVKR